MLRILVIVSFLLPSGQIAVRSAPLYADTYSTQVACAAVMDDIGIGAKIRVARIVSQQRPADALVTSLTIGCNAN